MVAGSDRWMWALLGLLSVVACEEQPTVVRMGRSKFILEALETSCDRNFVEYFHRVPNTAEPLYTFRVLKLASAFTIDFAVRVRKTQRVMYKLDNFDGCRFLENPLMNRIFGSVYKKLIVNGSFFSCPIKPGVYFLKNEGSVAMLPSFHPTGRYQVSMQVKMPNSRDPFVMQMLWMYNIVRIK
ncbi:uncharacterized protein LOC111080103 [Drosophila obscura]|uniref:uncharacterized protein LOC111080103 n=1 Tax=Drosophila obscura TaxID=7282 RepID=UPI001BB17AED|nr:uncharacterized protein LOC111080103 [Drosophila obscura]